MHPADAGGCGHYRLIFPTDALRRQGFDVTLEADRQYRAIFQPSPWGDKVVGIDEELDVDVVVVQRPLHRNRVELIQSLQARGVAVVVEIDDDFHALHKRNPAWEETHPARDRDKNRDWLLRACEIADLVTVTTPALADRYGRHGRVRILPNYVPAWYLEVEHPSNERPIIGWSGSTHTHPGDLEQTKGAVAHTVDVCDVDVAVVGTGEGVARALQLRSPVRASGWLPIDVYPRGVARFDIGIVPLRRIPFNEAKSNLKMSEMAALGVAAVGSPTGPNRELVALGAGLLADTAQEWHDTLTRLATHEDLRLEVAGKAREVMATRTYETNCDQWWDAWQAAAEHRQARRVA